MKIELSADAVQWVEAQIAAGTFLTPEDAVHYAVGEVRTNASLAMSEATAPKRTPQEAAARMLARRPFHHLPEGTSLRDLMAHGRA